MVASVNFHRGFDLEEIARNFRIAEYEPEVFPGPIFRMEESSVVFLLFMEGEGVWGPKARKRLKRASTS